MTAGRLSGQHALVVTPFLPLPADAGQRKRVLQFHELLRSLGCHITLLHYAVEQPFAWAQHDGIAHAVQEMMDETITVQVGPAFGRPPLSGGAHRLDEWWDPTLSDTVQRLFARRWFDLVVVNNVWLTKVFDFAPPGVVKILESHDVFSDRIEALRAIGAEPDFFVCDRSDESFGWNRVDVVVAIADEERRTMANHLRKAKAVALPYAEEMMAPRQQDYVHPGKVVFGFFGSAHPFNVHGLKALIAQLSRVARWAPIELTIAGEVGRALTPDEAALVTDLGYVKSPDDFYDAIDIFVSPLDFGSGLKIKVVEAISKGIPTLITEHSAIGTCIDGQFVVKDVAALAEAMARIAHRRPDLDLLSEALGNSQANLAQAVEDGTRRLVDAIEGSQRRTILHYPQLASKASDPHLWSLIGMIREIGNRGPIALDLGDGAAEPSWLRYLHPRVQLVGPTPEVTGFGDSRPRIKRDRLAGRLDFNMVISNDPHYRLNGAAMHVHDARWSRQDAPDHATHVLRADGFTVDAQGQAVTSGFPWWSESLNWDPILPKPKKPAGAPWIALVAPATGSAALRALIETVSHAAIAKARIFEIGAEVIPVDLITQMRAEPPVLVIEFGWAATPTLVSEWCATTRIAYLGTLSAATALDAVTRSHQQPQSAADSLWRSVLDGLFVVR